MERAGRLLAQLKNKDISSSGIACAAWAKAVGRRLETRTRAACLVRSTLVVEVEDAVWQRQLFAIRGNILQNLNRLLGAGIVTDLEFRIAVARRPPQAVGIKSAVAGPLFADEADGIQDPVLRMVYQESRRRAGQRVAG